MAATPCPLCASTAGPKHICPGLTAQLVGKVLDGRYKLESVLGQGGMGVVYRALDLRLRRTVALKLLRAHTSADRRAKERLLVEARAAAALDHPNICTIYEVGETPDGTAFIAMAFYPGETLEQVRAKIDLTDQQKLFAGDSRHRGFIFKNYVTLPATAATYKHLSGRPQ